MCLNYLRGHRYFGYHLNPEVEHSFYPTKFLLLVTATLVVVTAYGFVTAPLSSSLNLRVSAKATLRAVAGLLIAYWLLSGVSLLLAAGLKFFSLNLFVLSTTGSLFFFLVYYLNSFLVLVPVESRVRNSLIANIVR